MRLLATAIALFIFWTSGPSWAAMTSAEVCAYANDALATTTQVVVHFDPHAVTEHQLAEVKRVMTDALGKEIPDNVWSIGQHAFHQSEGWIVHTDDGRPIAIASLEHEDAGHPYLTDTPYASQPTSYFSAAMINPKAQGTGVYRDLNETRLRRALSLHDPIIMVRTQNPRVEAGIQHGLQRQVAIGQITSFKLVVRKRMNGVYGDMLTHERPHIDNPEIQQHYDQLDYDQGDAYVIAFEVTYP